MRVLVLGGTGAIGEYLLQFLKEKGIEVVVTSRSFKLSKTNIRFIKGNAKDISFLMCILKEQWDVIIDFMVYSTTEFESRLMLLLGATSQYIFFSSSRVHASSKSPLSEKSPRLLDVSTDQEYLSTDEYALSKARQENLLINSAYKNWTIIRPYITYSEKRLQLGPLEKEEWLFRVLHGKGIVFHRDMCLKLTTMTFGGDVARSVAALIGNKNAFGEIFNISSNTAISWNSILNIYSDVILKIMGYKPKLTLVNENEFLECKPSKYQIYYDRLFDRQFDNSKIAKYIKAESFVAVESELRKCLELFLKNPIFKEIDWRSEAIKDRYTKECMSLRIIPGIKNKIKYLSFRFLLK